MPGKLSIAKKRSRVSMMTLAKPAGRSLGASSTRTPAGAARFGGGGRTEGAGRGSGGGGARALAARLALRAEVAELAREVEQGGVRVGRGLVGGERGFGGALVVEVERHAF